MKNAFLIGLAVIVLIGAGVLIGRTEKGDTEQASPTPSSSASATSDLQGAEVLSGSVSISIVSFAFTPDVIRIAKGSTVTWTNNDSAQHSVVSADSATLSSKVLNKGESYEHTFNDIETVSYHCGVHPFMSGTIQVVEK